MKYKFEDIAINSTVKKKPEESDKYHYIGLEHLEPGNLFVHKYGSEVAPIGEKLLMKKGDVLFGKRRAYQKKVAIAPCDGIFSAHGMVLRPNEKVINKEYFPFFISSDNFLNEAIRISVGSLSPTINWRDLKELEFELPPIEEQKSLAKLLWAAYELKKSYKKLITATDEMVKAQFIEIFDKTKDKKQWKEMLTVIYGKAFRGDYIPSGTYPVCGSGGIMGYSNIKNCKKNTIIIGRKGNISNPILMETDYWLIDTAFCLDINQKKLNPMFFYHWCKQFDFIKLNKQTALPSLTKTDLEEIIMCVPLMEQQVQFEVIARQADKSKTELQQSIQNIDKVMKSLLP